MSFAAATQRFAAQAARQRMSTWPVTVLPTGTSTARRGAKAPTTLGRVENEHRTGFVQRAIATFHFPQSGAYRPDIGAEFTITSTQTTEEVDTVWRCFELTRADDNIGSDHRCVCFRLD